MAAIISDNIISPLGLTAEETCQAVMAGRSALQSHEPSAALPFKHTSALFTEQQNNFLRLEGFSRFESLAIRSITSALAKANVNHGERSILIICSTKGNIEALGQRGEDSAEAQLGKSAQRVSAYLGLTEEPIVVCNACISGVSGLILGNRLVDTGKYERAIVCGIDVQSPFVISGFQSLKALSQTRCRPFDMERTGLNLGEAAATIILGREHSPWRIRVGAINNDAHHITNPSPKAEGCAMSIEYVLEGIDKESIAMINAHGTATMFNDQMESKAISRCGLSSIPANALKGYLGHTMGAAGVIETIVTMKTLEKGLIVGTKGFEEIGVSGHVNISGENRRTDKTDFLKIISGFGGGNGALLVSKRHDEPKRALRLAATRITHRVRITPTSVEIDGEAVSTDETGLKLLTALYKRYVPDYPKFYKMDPLARLGFVAAQMLLSLEKDQTHEGKRGVVFFNTTGSLNADHEYLKTISDSENFFPSPSLFVYTLPNIVTGEIALYNHLHGETAFYIVPQRDEQRMSEVIDATFEDRSLGSLITGWLEYNNENDYEANINITTR